MVQEGKYIYGIIGKGEEKEFGPIGIGDRQDTVYTIPYQDISAVVSDSQIVDYTHMLKDAVARLLLGHQKVIEKIMNLEYTIIPTRLGTFASNEKEVSNILDKGYRIIRDIFREISGRIEIDVVATWSDFNSVLKEVGEE
ncbi:GvpL/GvpF family gas vesicle protein, partial [bacterium]|nr:GvpL/GvpF family gas vesicle protein [bacterium]